MLKDARGTSSNLYDGGMIDELEELIRQEIKDVIKSFGIENSYNRIYQQVTILNDVRFFEDCEIKNTINKILNEYKEE